MDMIMWGKHLFSLVRSGDRERGSVTIENVIWAIAVIAIAAIVVAAITAYVTSRSGELLGP